VEARATHPDDVAHLFPGAEVVTFEAHSEPSVRDLFVQLVSRFLNPDEAVSLVVCADDAAADAFAVQFMLNCIVSQGLQRVVVDDPISQRVKGGMLRAGMLQ
jgi:hypothetical protein